MENIIVVGASGVLGQMICRELQRLFNENIHLIVTDYNYRRGEATAAAFGEQASFRPLDINQEEQIASTIQDVSCVVVAAKQKLPLIQQHCAKQGILCLDVTVFSGFVEQVRQIGCPHSASIVMAGFFPGLSGLMVRQAITGFNEVHEVNVGLLQNTNAQAGLSGIKDMLSIVSGRSAEAPAAKDTVTASKARTRNMEFAQPFGQRTVRRIPHAEAPYLSSYFGVRGIHYWTAWQSSGFNRMVQLLDKLHVIPFILSGKADRLLSSLVRHNPNQGEHCALSVEVTGLVEGLEKTKTLVISVPSDYRTTALFTAALAKLTLDKSAETIDKSIPQTIDKRIPQTIDKNTFQTIDKNISGSIDKSTPRSADKTVSNKTLHNHTKKLAGVLFPFEFIELRDILDIMDSPDIILHEFNG